MDEKTFQLVLQTNAAMFCAFVVFAELLDERGILNKAELANALALVPDRLEEDNKGEVAMMVLDRLQDALLNGLQPDLNDTPEWLRNAIQSKPGSSPG